MLRTRVLSVFFGSRRYLVDSINCVLFDHLEKLTFFTL